MSVARPLQQIPACATNSGLRTVLSSGEPGHFRWSKQRKCSLIRVGLVLVICLRSAMNAPQPSSRAISTSLSGVRLFLTNYLVPPFFGSTKFESAQATRLGKHFAQCARLPDSLLANMHDKPFRGRQTLEGTHRTAMSFVTSLKCTYT